MVEVLTPTSDEIHTLDAKRSAEVVERALADRTPIRVLAAVGECEVALFGTLMGLNETTLSIELDEHTSFDDLGGVDLNSASFHITLESAETPFFFCTPSVTREVTPSSRLIEVQRPEIINAIERRLYRRQTLREPKGVTFSLPGAANAWQCRAAVLNASPTGIACRVGPSDAPRLRRGTEVNVSLDGASATETLSLLGRVVDVTQSATEGMVVLGIEFPGPRNSTTACNQFWNLLQKTDERS